MFCLYLIIGYYLNLFYHFFVENFDYFEEGVTEEYFEYFLHEFIDTLFQLKYFESLISLDC
jgi:hypothetical protein